MCETWAGWAEPTTWASWCACRIGSTGSAGVTSVRCAIKGIIAQLLPSEIALFTTPLETPMTTTASDPQGRQFEELDVTVDTGSTYTAVPRAMLQRLGIPVERSLPSETADGRIVPVDVGEATIRLQGMQFHTPVIFAEENEPILLGVVSLEQAALAVDPLAGRLIPTNLLRL